MKVFINYLKWKPTWIGILVFSILYFLMAQAYVYPMLTFDFSVIYEWETWFQLIFINTGMTVLNLDYALEFVTACPEAIREELKV